MSLKTLHKIFCKILKTCEYPQCIPSTLVPHFNDDIFIFPSPPPKYMTHLLTSEHILIKVFVYCFLTWETLLELLSRWQNVGAYGHFWWCLRRVGPDTRNSVFTGYLGTFDPFSAAHVQRFYCSLWHVALHLHKEIGLLCKGQETSPCILGCPRLLKVRTWFQDAPYTEWGWLVSGHQA